MANKAFAHSKRFTTCGPAQIRVLHLLCLLYTKGQVTVYKGIFVVTRMFALMLQQKEHCLLVV